MIVWQDMGLSGPFKPNKELDQQDKLMTWIEFLNHEYQNYDRSVAICNHWQPQHDEAWDKLVALMVLEPWETEESLWGFSHRDQETKE